MTKDELTAVRMVIRHEIAVALRDHLSSFAKACMGPVCEALGEVLENQKEISRGQLLVEKHLASDSLNDETDSDGEGWRESLR